MSDSVRRSGLCRVIALIDVDSFECQIWQRKYPRYNSHPCVVADAGGRIVSVTSEAKEFGITRDHRVHEAKRFCNHLKVFTKPNKYSKPDSSELRAVSYGIQSCIFKFCRKKKITVERVSTDEWFLDLSKCVQNRIAKAEQDENDPIPDFDEYEEDGEDLILETSRKLGVCKLLARMERLEEKFPDYSSEEQRLVIGAGITDELLDRIFEKTQFICSVGVSYNKLLAKQACKLNKPNNLTILSSFGLKRVSKIIRVRDLHGLGGNLGDKVSAKLRFVKTMWDLKQLDVAQLTYCGFDFDEAEYLYDLARGICEENVIRKPYSKSLNCSKYNLRVRDIGSFRRWLHILSQEMIARLEEEWDLFKRKPNSLKVKCWYIYEDDEGDYLEGTIERTMDYDEEIASRIPQNCFMEITNGGFYLHHNNGTTLTRLTLSAKSFERYY